MKKTYLNFLNTLALTGILASLVIVTSCGDDDGDTPVDPVEPATDSILDIINANVDEDLDSLKKYLNIYPSLTAIVGNESGTYTMFAPTDDAFISLLQTPGFPSDIADINPDIIEGVLAYHVVSGSAVASSEFTEANDLNSLYTDAATQEVQIIEFNADGTVLTGSTTTNIAIEEADIQATNGVMHKTGSVLIPPSVGATLTPILGTNAGTLLLGAEFTILASGIALADAYAAGDEQIPSLTGILAGTDIHTVFAPTDATFLSEALVDVYPTFTGEQWYGIIANHVVINDGNEADDNEVIDEDELASLAMFTSAAANTLLIIESAPTNGLGIYIDGNGDFDATDGSGLDAEVVVIDAAAAGNGTVHVIAGVLTPPQ